METENQRHHTIFVVEDDADVRDSLSALTTAAGQDCVVFDSAEALLAHASPTCCGLIVIDADLPGMSGIELLKCLRKINQSVKAVFYTAHTDDGMRLVAQSLGVPLFEKGTGESDLLEFVRACLRS